MRRWAALWLVACGGVEEAGVVDADDAEDPDAGQRPPPPAAECAERWEIPWTTAAIADTQYVPYQGASGCTGSASAGAVQLGNYLRTTFPGNGGYGVYSCRSIAGSSSYSLHSEGRAIDFMIPLDGSQAYGADNDLGDRVGNWLIENAEVIGIQRVIWDRTIWDGNDPVPKDHCVDISNPHWDHLHIELTWDAANRLTPWFSGGTTTTPGAPGGPGAEPDPHVDPPGTFIIDSNNSYNEWAWGCEAPSSWTSSTAAPGYFNTGYWQAPTAYWGLDFTDFWFLRGEPGCLSAWAWWPNSPSHAPDTFFIAYSEPNGHVPGWSADLIEHGRATLDQRVNGSQWNYIGSFNFNQTWNKISVDRWTTSLTGTAVADAIKIIPSGLCVATPSVPGQVFIDDENANNDITRYYAYVPPSWNNPTWVVPAWMFGQRQAPTSYWGLDFVDFHFWRDTPACLDVDAWWTANAGNAPDTYMIAYHQPNGPFNGFSFDQITELGRAEMDQRDNGSRWNRVGSYNFPAGWNKISVDRWTESLVGWAVADGIRLTPSAACPAPAPVCGDADGDGTSDCDDACPSDPAKVLPGDCGCGVADVDADGDGLPACFDACDGDAAKTAPGACGCGVPDEDITGDGVADCTICGDGLAEAPEGCDDGDRVAGDGCSALCQTETMAVGISPGTAGVTNQVVVVSATPGDRIHVVASTRAGTTPVPGCPGVTLPIARPTVVGQPVASAAGRAVFNLAPPASMAGVTARFVAVDLVTCAVSPALVEAL
jgi:cysteine-rich repeat protein